MKAPLIGKYILFLIAGVLLLTGVFKIVGAAEAGEEFGNPNAPYLLAGVEILAAIAIILAKTRLLGGLLAASYFGGVICFQWLTEGVFPGVGMGINPVLYLGLALYRPSLRDGGPVVVGEPVRRV